jgi:hypothetical protein
MRQFPNKMERVLVKFMEAEYTAKRISGGTPPNCGR